MDSLQHVIRFELLFVLKTIAAFRHSFWSIPATFWGVVIGSLFSLGGVALTNRASDKRLFFQFEHERKQKAKEREMELRKEVFLDAADAVTSGINTLSRFANLDLTYDQITNEYNQKSSVISKVHVIAKEDTIRAMANFTGELATSFLQLSIERLELTNIKDNIEVVDEQIATYSKERDRILEIMKLHNLDGINDERRWTFLQESFNSEVDRINEALPERAKLVGMLQPKHFEFLRQCTSHTEKLTSLLVPALIAVRAELELPLDADRYQQVVNENNERMKLTIDEFLKEAIPQEGTPTDHDDSP